MKSQHKQLIVLSAPSGGGKTTVAKHLFTVFPQLTFSVSATTRHIRPGEVDGKDYYFLSHEEFQQKIAAGDLLEYEVIFDNYYGTLKSSVQRALDRGEVMVFDVDVKGALSLRKAFPDDTVLIFITPPTMDELEKRLRSRRTESEEQISLRLERAAMEMEQCSEFDKVIVNDKLSETLHEAEIFLGTTIT
jgi:guanylate kinase